MSKTWHIRSGSGPIVALAVHDGHWLRPELNDICALSDEDRLREEDPYTHFWTDIVETSLIPYRSRFEVDLNRAREEAVYKNPQDAWGLNLWKSPLTQDKIDSSLEYYDEFYSTLYQILKEKEEKYRSFVVLDIHSYNHRRGGPEAEPEDPQKNPEINIGTGRLDRLYWAPLLDNFMQDIREFDFDGRSLDVRENVKFIGRQIPQFVRDNFPKTGCAIAIEFKKIFMDEWTGTPDRPMMEKLKQALNSTIPGLIANLKKYA